MPDDPDAVTEVRRTNGGSWNSVPLCVIPERGKVCENGCESSAAKSPDVLHEHVAGSKVANETAKLSPQAGSLTVQAGTLAGEADVLAGEAAADGGDSFDAVGSKPGSVKLSDVVIAGNSGPVLGQHAPAPRVDLAEGDGLEPGALKAQREAADARKQVEQPHAALPIHACCRSGAPASACATMLLS